MTERPQLECIGCAPAGERSMMARRVWPKAIPASASTKTPLASGPRWASFPAMAPASAASSWVPERHPRSRKPAMPHMTLNPHLHPIIGHFPPGSLHGSPLRRVLAQHGIGIIDVDEDLTLYVKRGEGGHGPPLPRHVHVPHAVPRLVEQPLRDHLVIGVEGAVEED